MRHPSLAVRPHTTAAFDWDGYILHAGQRAILHDLHKECKATLKLLARRYPINGYPVTGKPAARKSVIRLVADRLAPGRSPGTQSRSPFTATRKLEIGNKSWAVAGGGREDLRRVGAGSGGAWGVAEKGRHGVRLTVVHFPPAAARLPRVRYAMG